MVYMVPNGVFSINSIGHHRNGLYGAQWYLNNLSLGTIEMVYMVPNGVSLNAIGHHRNGLYGAQWCLFKRHWAP